MRPGIGRNTSCTSGDRLQPRELWFSIYSCNISHIVYTPANGHPTTRPQYTHVHTGLPHRNPMQACTCAYMQTHAHAYHITPAPCMVIGHSMEPLVTFVCWYGEGMQTTARYLGLRGLPSSRGGELVRGLVEPLWQLEPCVST